MRPKCEYRAVVNGKSCSFHCLFVTFVALFQFVLTFKAKVQYNGRWANSLSCQYLDEKVTDRELEPGSS